MGRPRVVAAHDGHGTLDLAVDDVVVQRLEAPAELATQHVADVLVREAGNHRTLDVRDVDFGYVAVLVVVDRHPDDVLGDLERAVLVKLHAHGAFDVRLLRGGDHVGVEVLSHSHQTLEHALDVGDHKLHRTGHDGQFLMKRVACRRNAATHPDLVGRAADTGKGDAGRALALGVLDQLGVL